LSLRGPVCFIVARLDGSTIFFRADDFNTSGPNFAGMFPCPVAAAPLPTRTDF
jgi:hypothetical protein